ncbi:NADH-quinone oxidoreductase subunit L [Pararhodobacter zhoushanensis]|uniref:NADH-quinone oxidoreductase subunit L n=1 Tax=Pararhodobacter zhoushanensis TaxID=2479545 RepID=A0ABT3GZE4_9RHOB|nr:NADH-quinone oxidoreductase subunit L [Pararhodobacter zhoushanensis]MCW1932933.1 NADH-quinone oxidoreductase subunit L [Pararhodobacter zhoushanensis]
MATTLLFAPLVGAIICGLFWRMIGEKTGMVIATALLFLSALLSWILFLSFDGHDTSIQVLRFIDSGSLVGGWGIRLDRLTTVMLIVVTTVSALVHLYSFGYMAHDENWTDSESYRARFFAYLSLFTFAMLMLVTADNLIQIFFGWEGVGLASYLLIGFYWKKQSASAAAMKAFIVNRVGDFGFIIGIMMLYFMADSVQFDDIFHQAEALSQQSISFLGTDWNALNTACFFLFIGAMGKSAQLFLHTWLPDAMEGPTPVSALIHAATMVTAGVFLICRMSPLMEYANDTRTFIVLIGSATAFFAATVGLVQNDIKRVIAYSTCSQLGYMFVAAGVGVYSVAMFHLLTHAFFKAMLFLGAGSVIHGMHHEQDMRNYGGLRKKLPYTFYAMMIGTLAITGVGIPFTHIGFAGFVSKDAIIESAMGGGATYAYVILVAAAAMTSFYSWRLIFLTFYGTPRGDHHTHDHAHESPLTMVIPLGILAIGAVFAGMIWYEPFFGSHDAIHDFFGHSIAMLPTNETLHNAHENLSALTKLAPFLAMLVGFVLAYIFYIWKPETPAKLAANQPILYRFLLNKWYFDEIYNFVFIKPTLAIGRFLWKRGDGNTIDGFLNGLTMGVMPMLNRVYARVQSGYIYTYAFAMVIGIAVLVTYVTLSGGAH